MLCLCFAFSVPASMIVWETCAVQQNKNRSRREERVWAVDRGSEPQRGKGRQRTSSTEQHECFLAVVVFRPPFGYPALSCLSASCDQSSSHFCPCCPSLCLSSRRYVSRCRVPRASDTRWRSASSVHMVLFASSSSFPSPIRIYPILILIHAIFFFLFSLFSLPRVS